MNVSRAPGRGRLAPLLIVVIPWTAACRAIPTAAPSPALPPTPATIAPVTLPPLDAVQAEVRAQIEAEHARLRDLEQAGESGAALGAAYGTLGQILLAYGFRAAAEVALNDARILLPRSPEWPYYLAKLREEDGRRAQAEADYRLVLDLAPDEVPARVRLAALAADEGRIEEARNLLEQALDRDPEHAYAYFQLGQLLAATGDARGAIAAFERVRTLAPEATMAVYPLAMAYRAAGDLARAEALLAGAGDVPVPQGDPRTDALAALKQGSNIFLLRGGALMRQGRAREALPLFEKAVAAAPEDPMTYLDLGAARFLLEDRAGAIEAVRRAAALDPGGSEGARVQTALGAYLAADGQAAAAEAAFHAALGLDPGHSNARMRLADLLRQTGRCGEAIDAYAVLLEETPNELLARLRHALCLNRLGRGTEALSVVEEGLALFPDDRDLRDAQARLLAASAEAEVRDGARALALAEALRAEHESVDTLETLAMAQAEMGRFEEARRTQEAAIARAEAEGRSEWQAVLQANLARYARGEALRQPWPDFLYSR